MRSRPLLVNHGKRFDVALYGFGLGGDQLRNFSEFGRDLLRPFCRLSPRLLDLHAFDFERMHATLHADDGTALLGRSHAKILVSLVCCGECGFRLGCDGLRFA